VLNTTWNIANFRSGLIRALMNAGYEVVAAAPPDDHVNRVKALGCRYISLPMDNKGTHPGRDFLLLCRIFFLLLRERPQVLLGYTVKPNVYGSLAAHALGVPVVNNIAGLGAVFITDSWITRLVRGLYKVALSRSAKVFFQNEDDRRLFVEGDLVDFTKTDLVPGSGINLRRFAPAPLLTSRRPVRFLLIARMLWDKGVGEFVEAARMIKRRGANADFCLLGFLDVQNPAAVMREEMQAWVDEGVVKYLGATDDVRQYIAEADCVVLPSYREGTPRSLLEAAAMARPIITTDAVGCREVVDDGVNGFLCRTRDSADLAEKIQRMIALPPDARAAMGRKGREKVERQFDENIVLSKYLATIAEIVGQPFQASSRA
jgi:glycosyltransferase involved in cell wall biosynthesis